MLVCRVVCGFVCPKNCISLFHWISPLQAVQVLSTARDNASTPAYVKEALEQAMVRLKYHDRFLSFLFCYVEACTNAHCPLPSCRRSCAVPSYFHQCQEAGATLRRILWLDC